MTSPRWGLFSGTERIFALTFLVLATIAWCSLTLAELGAFTAPRLWSIGVPLVAVGAWFIWREAPQQLLHGALVPRRHVLAALACLVTTIALIGRPADYLINGSDASVYLNIASAIERRGGISVTEPLLAHLDDETREAFFGRDPIRPHLLDFFPGGIQIAADGSRLQPNFFHLVPAAIAGFSALTGSPESGLLVLPLAGLLTLTAAWLLAVRLSSPLAATVAVVLLTVNFAQIWYSRFPSSEGLTACFLLCGLWFAVRAARDGSAVSGLLGGAAFGLAACTRLEVLVLVSPLVVGYLAVVFLGRRWTRAQTWFALGLGLLTSQAVLHALFVSTPYTERILRWVFGTSWLWRGTVVLVPAVVMAAVVLGWLVRRGASSFAVPPVGRALLAAALVAAIVRAWPPLLSGPAALLFTPLGLVAMACGVVWLALDDPAPEVLLLVAVFLASAFVYIETPRAGRVYPMPWRRYVPVVLPIGMLLVGHITAILWRQRAPWRWLAAGLVVFLTLHGSRQSQVLAAVAPMGGLRDGLARIAQSLPARTVLIADSTLPSHLGLSLHFTFEQPVLAIRRGPGTSAALARLAASLAGTGWSLALAIAPQATPRGLTPADFAGLDLAPLSAVTLEWNELEPTPNRVPTNLRTPVVNVQLYAVRPHQPASLPLSIDIGGSDFPWRGDGFHATEDIGGARVRWTTGTARIQVPAVAHAGHARLIFRMATPRPPGRPPARVTITIGQDVELVTPELTGDLQDVSFDLDPGVVERLAAGTTTLTLRTTPFVPRDVGGGDDGRELGVVLDWLRFEPR